LLIIGLGMDGDVMEVDPKPGGAEGVEQGSMRGFAARS
jgi:hypothetical protein